MYPTWLKCVIRVIRLIDLFVTTSNLIIIFPVGEALFPVGEALIPVGEALFLYKSYLHKRSYGGV